MTITAILILGAIGVCFGVIAWDIIETRFRALRIKAKWKDETHGNL